MIKKVAVVSGANKGIGFALVKGLCEDFDGLVYLTSRDEKRGREAVKKLKTLRLSPLYHQLDICDPRSVQRFAEHIEKEHGKVDILINNAGILFRKDSEEPMHYQAEQTIAVNYRALVRFCEKFVPLVRDGGRIVNISSSSGHLSRIPSEVIRKRFADGNLVTEGLTRLTDEYIKCVETGTAEQEGWGPSPYVVSKVAVNAYTFILQRENDARDIKVNCVHPGYVASDMTNQVGNITPEEGASVALHVALRCGDEVKGAYFWHNKSQVPWSGPDPRVYIDNQDV